MAYKQEPCPLCGRNMTAIETYPGRGELYCGHCDLTIGGNDAKTPEELIALMDSSEHRRLKTENAKLRKLVVLGIMLPLNEEQLDWLDKTFVSELGEGLYVQLEKLGIEVTK
jgi:hypothetical protein